MWFWLGVVAAGCVLFALLFSMFISSSFLSPPFHRHRPGGEFAHSGMSVHPAWGDKVHDPMTDLALEFSSVSFAAGGDSDTHGHHCRGWLIDRRNKPGAKATCVVFVHGGGRDRRAWLRHSEWVCRAGYSALMYDSRGHGLSDGHARLTFGINESEDVEAAVAFLQKEHNFTRFVLIGTSIGGVSSILAAHRLGPEVVAGVVAENAFTSIDENVKGLVHKIAFSRVLFRHNATLMWLSTPLRRAVEWVTLRRVNSLLGPAAQEERHQAINIIGKLHSSQRVLLMHGTADQLIDHDHTMQLHEQLVTPRRRARAAARGAVGPSGTDSAGSETSRGDLRRRTAAGASGSPHGGRATTSTSTSAAGGTASATAGAGGGSGAGGGDSEGDSLHPLDRDGADLWLAEGADHTVLYDKWPQEFKRRVMMLLERVERDAVGASSAGAGAATAEDRSVPASL